MLDGYDRGTASRTSNAAISPTHLTPEPLRRRPYMATKKCDLPSLATAADRTSIDPLLSPEPRSIVSLMEGVVVSIEKQIVTSRLFDDPPLPDAETEL